MIKLIRNSQKGMTYVELIVVLSIFAIMSAVSLGEYSTFQDRIKVKVLASDIALSIRQAQVDAMSGKQSSTGSFVSPNRPAYGVEFDKSGSGGYSYFADFNNDNLLSDGESPETISLGNGNSIKNFLKYDNSTSSSSLDASSALDVSFKRTVSGATFYYNDQALNSLTAVGIVIESPKGNQAIIKVYSSGQIVIQ